MTLAVPIAAHNAVPVSNRYFRLVLYSYVVVSCIASPLLTPLRVFEIWNSAYLVYANVGFVALFALAAPSPGAFLPDRYMLMLLLACLFIGMLVGLPNIETSDGSVRYYAAHGFQLLSAYVMFAIGRSQRGELWSEPIMRGLMLLTIGADFAGTALIYGYGVQVQLGGYVVGSGASFIALCFFAPRNRAYTALSLLVLLVTGKRGPLVAGAVVFAISLALPRLRERMTGITFTSLVFLGVCVAVGAFITTIVRPDAFDEIVENVEYRLSTIPKALIGTDEAERRTAAGGRYDELEAMTQDFGVLEWMVGRGFGFQVSFASEEESGEIHQAHFSPGTLAARFGLPFALGFYIYFAVMIGSGFRRRIEYANANSGIAWIRQRETALLFLVGGTLISFTAFTIFVDLFFMLFLGVLSAWPPYQERKAGPVRDVPSAAFNKPSSPRIS